MSRLQELQERRAYECRLTPDRALETIDEAEAFLRDRSLLTRTADSALPSLYEACHEDPYAPGRGGFGEWPATKWRWVGGPAERWDQAFPEPAEGRGGLEELLVAAVRAAVVAPEKEAGRWFAWRSELVEGLVAEGRLERPEPGWIAAAA